MIITPAIMKAAPASATNAFSLLLVVVVEKINQKHNTATIDLNIIVFGCEISIVIKRGVCNALFIPSLTPSWVKL